MDKGTQQIKTDNRQKETGRQGWIEGKNEEGG